MAREARSTPMCVNTSRWIGCCRMLATRTSTPSCASRAVGPILVSAARSIGEVPRNRPSLSAATRQGPGSGAWPGPVPPPPRVANVPPVPDRCAAAAAAGSCRMPTAVRSAPCRSSSAIRPVVFEGAPAPGLSWVSDKTTGRDADAEIRIAFATASAAGRGRCAANSRSAASSAENSASAAASAAAWVSP